jgi:DNA-binding LacI/PurR family transcriptional regulator
VARYAGLTTVAQPLEQSGARGAELLLAALDGGKVDGELLPVELVPRSTTAGRKERGREACTERNEVRS